MRTAPMLCPRPGPGSARRRSRHRARRCGSQGGRRHHRTRLDRQGRRRQQAGPHGQGLQVGDRRQGSPPDDRSRGAVLEPGQQGRRRLHRQGHLQRSRADLQPSAPVRRVHRRQRPRLGHAGGDVLRGLSQRQLHHPDVQRRQARRHRRATARPRGGEEGRDAEVPGGPGSGLDGQGRRGVLRHQRHGRVDRHQGRRHRRRQARPRPTASSASGSATTRTRWSPASASRSSGDQPDVDAMFRSPCTRRPRPGTAPTCRLSIGAPSCAACPARWPRCRSRHCPPRRRADVGRRHRGGAGHAAEVGGPAATEVRRHRPEPRPHHRHDRRDHARRRRARLGLREGAGPAEAVPGAVPQREGRAERGRSARRRVGQGRAEREHSRRAGAARHPRDAGRQGLHRRQAGHHVARAAGRGAQGAGRDEAHLLDRLQRAVREPRHGQGRRTGQGGRDRQGAADHRPRSAPRRATRAAPSGSSTSPTTAASSPTSRRTRPTSSCSSRDRRRPRSSRRRPATSTRRSTRSSRTSAT